MIARQGPPQGDVLANWKRVGSSRYPQWDRIDFKDLPEKSDDPDDYEAYEGAYARFSPRKDNPKPWRAYYQRGRSGDLDHVRSKRSYKTEKEALLETDRLFPIDSPVKRYLYKLAEIPAKEMHQLKEPVVFEKGIFYPSVEQNKPSAESKEETERPQETKWGVWLASKSNGLSGWNCRTHSEFRFPTPEAAKASPLYTEKSPVWEYQIRVYINKYTPGNLWIEPKSDTSSLKKSEKLSDWVRCNFRDIPNVGRVCDYVLEVPECKLTFKVVYLHGWTVYARYTEGHFQWLRCRHDTLEEAKRFCEEKAGVT